MPRMMCPGYPVARKLPTKVCYSSRRLLVAMARTAELDDHQGAGEEKDERAPSFVVVGDEPVLGTAAEAGVKDYDMTVAVNCQHQERSRDKEIHA